MSYKFNINDFNIENLREVDFNFLTNFGNFYGKYTLVRETILDDQFQIVKIFVPFEKYKNIFSNIRIIDKSKVWSGYFSKLMKSNSIPNENIEDGTHGPIITYFTEIEVKEDYHGSRYSDHDKQYIIGCNTKDYATLRMLSK